MRPKNTICLWFNTGDALEAARFYARTFPDSAVGHVFHAPGDYPAAPIVLSGERIIIGLRLTAPIPAQHRHQMVVKRHLARCRAVNGLPPSP